MKACGQQTQTHHHFHMKTLTQRLYRDNLLHNQTAGTHQTQEPQNHIQNLHLGKQVLSEFNARQGLQESDRSAGQKTRDWHDFGKT